MLRYLVILLASLALALSAAPSAVGDGVSVADGDSLRIDGERIRLWGIDAPELAQKCEMQGVTYECGITARDTLASLVGDEMPECKTVDIDRYGRTVARCFVNGDDLGGRMVTEGWALDFTRYSNGYYAVQQEAAKKAERGLWAGEFETPWEWRRTLP